jgi:hypothetical protein
MPVAASLPIEEALAAQVPPEASTLAMQARLPAEMPQETARTMGSAMAKVGIKALVGFIILQLMFLGVGVASAMLSLFTGFGVAVGLLELMAWVVMAGWLCNDLLEEGRDTLRQSRHMRLSAMGWCARLGAAVGLAQAAVVVLASVVFGASASAIGAGWLGVGLLGAASLAYLVAGAATGAVAYGLIGAFLGGPVKEKARERSFAAVLADKEARRPKP